MRVIQILPQLNIGGVERGTLDLSKALIEQGHESFVISGGGILVDELIRSGAKHYEIPVHIKSLRTLYLAKSLSEKISSIDPDIVHIRSRMPAWVNYRAFKMLKKNLFLYLLSMVFTVFLFILKLCRLLITPLQYLKLLRGIFLKITD